MPKGAIAAVFIAALMIAYSFDALAHYGKKIIGYDNVACGSLKRLNDEGAGQEINKSVTFSNGIEFTLDGIMFDDNELVAFYRLKSTAGKLDYTSLHLFMNIGGIKSMGYPQKSGQGNIVDDYNVIFIMSFESPEFYEKWMKLNISIIVDGKREEKSISFTLDRNMAMKRTVVKKLNKEVRVGDYNVRFDKLTASLLSTYINGVIEPLADEAKKPFRRAFAIDSADRQPHLVFDLVTDKGEMVIMYGGNSRTGKNVISFSNHGDGLPEEFNTLEIKNIRLESQRIIDKSFDVSFETQNLNVDDEVVLKKVYFEDDMTCVVVSSRGVPVMGMFSGDEQMEIVEPELYDSEAVSDKAVDRTFRFEGKAQEMELRFKNVVYSVYANENESISIPAE
jgi:hypothetical protein